LLHEIKTCLVGLTVSDEEMEWDERKVSEWLKGCDKDHDDDMGGNMACSEGRQVPDSPTLSSNPMCA
jgi:hypothetical protein